MAPDILLLLALSVLIWISPFIAKALRMPTPPVEIILGTLLASAGLLYENTYFHLIAEVGFLYLMFLAGMEVNLKEITGSPPIVIRQAILFVVTLGVLAVATGLLLNFAPIVTASLPLISIGLLASLSKIYGRSQPWLNLAIIVGVLGEIASIATLTVLDAASTVGFGWELLLKLSYLLFFIAAIYLAYRFLQLLFWWFPELKKKLMPKEDTSDQDIRLSMALFFLMISVMMILHLELALGSFIAGVAISAFFHHEKSLEEKMSSLGFGFLVPIFFIHVGVSFDLASILLPGVLSGALLITGLMILLRILAAYHLRRLYGPLNALGVAFALSMPLTLLIAVATIGFNSGSIDRITYDQLILASLFEVIIAMSAVKILSKYREKKKQEAWKRERSGGVTPP
ncbi:cation:proton antiporter [Nitratifractor salsuginis]|uniref:Sodium/hydrogen exchanger n=1 Tax=Nitratifractor salsuginis (strain DSM 16511 / JCM 12458 / E9I37-1) TaxID=749222 RepID=E6WZ22_NITSE|nr:cation:proton antiporter [Nitratifractor salsuginis]ADV45472.1 sodium/hydrogen exchanger [Nitratifractor salsuginis DSM 16511]